MDAQRYVEHLRTSGDLIRLAHYDEKGWCNGRGMAIVIDRQESMAMMLENCGRVGITHVLQGAIVKFANNPGGESRIVGSPAYC